MTDDEMMPSPIDGAPTPTEKEAPPEPTVTLTFHADGSSRILASAGFEWDHFIRAAALLSRHANTMLDRAEFMATMQAQENARVAAALRGEKQGGMVPDILDIARRKGNGR